MSDFWRQIERLAFGRDTAGQPGGLETTLQPTWELPLWLVLSGLIASAAILFAVYWHERASAARPWKVLLAAVRLGLVGIGVLMLYGWTVQRHRTDLSDVVILLDDSASMALTDTYDDKAFAAHLKQRLASVKLDEPTRLNLAKALLLANNERLLLQLGERYNLKLYRAGGAARSLTGARNPAENVRQVAAEQPTSRLGNCVREVLESQRGRPTAAIVMLTDGVTTEGKPLSEVAQYARRKGVPLFFVGLGSDQPVRDLRLGDLLVDETVFAGDLVSFDFKVTAEGYTGPATVRLKRAGDAAVLAEQNFELGKPGEASPMRLSHRADKQGEFEYAIEVVPRQGEANTTNNAMLRKVVVREEVIRVLLVWAYPSYEFRFLKQVLERELNKDQPAEGKERNFRTVLQEADLSYVESDKSAEPVFPISRDELFSYDVVIFGDMNPSLLSPSIMNNIYEFVTVRGGGVIFVAGPRYTPLAYRDTPLEPLFPFDLDTVRIPDSDAVVTDSFRPRLTPLGVASPMMQLADAPAGNERLWREQLTPLRWFASVPDSLAGARVLAEHPEKLGDDGRPLPLILLQFVGAGKVVFHASDETHLWRFRVGDVFFARYWIQTIRYLSRAKLLGAGHGAELTTDRSEYRTGDAVHLRLRFLDDRLAPSADDGVTIVIQREEGERRNLTLRRDAGDRGTFEGLATQLPFGKYRAYVATPTFDGPPPAREFAISAPPGELARTRMNADELAAAAKLSGGAFYRFTGAEKLLDDLPRGRQVRIESLPPKPIWNGPLWAGLFITLIAAEWIFRKRLGLL